jgi:hypothetical protein
MQLLVYLKETATVRYKMLLIENKRNYTKLRNKVVKFFTKYKIIEIINQLFWKKSKICKRTYKIKW